MSPPPPPPPETPPPVPAAAGARRRAAPRRAVFTRAGIGRGVRLGVPLAPGVFIYGLVFGVLASGAGLFAWEAALVSAFVYSGTAQLAAVQAWPRDPAVLPLLLAILVLNARYVLYGAALRPWMGGLPPAQAYGSLFFLGDGNWALAMRRHEEGEDDAGVVLGSGLASFLPWVAGTLVGHVGGAAVSDPRRFGLDAMLVAFSAAWAVSMAKGREDVAPALAAVAAALLVHRVSPGGWAIVAAGLAGALAAAWRVKPTAPVPGPRA